MKIQELDTPTLLIDQDILMANLKRMQTFADSNRIDLRPHIKTHKMPYIAAIQCNLGAQGIAVAKVGEAEAMVEYGLDDIMIANEIVGKKKLMRIAALMDRCKLRYGADSIFQIQEAEAIFSVYQKTAQIVIEIEVGEARSGVSLKEDFCAIIKEIQRSPHVTYCGVFGHDGNTYQAESLVRCTEISLQAQEQLLRFAAYAEELGETNECVSYGSTPAALCNCKILKGITDLRVGTYALMDASQAHIAGSFSDCAATVLATVISRPTEDRVVLDVGAKGLTMQERTGGICNSNGKGKILGYPDVSIDKMYDEHAIIHNRVFREAVKVGDKVRIIPAHICPTVNLYDTAAFHSGDTVIKTVPILCRGKLQ